MQVEEPFITGQASFFGAVMSEQAVRTTAAMMAAAAKSLLRVIGKTPDKRRVRALGN
jgi:di/tricarboxylate transporter